MSRAVLWTLAAVLGVLLVAGVTAAASKLSTQTIGLSSEPLSAGEDLVPTATPSRTPAATRTPKPKPKRKKTPRPTPTATLTPVPTAVPTVDDHGGDDSSGGHGSDDSGGDDNSGHGGGDDD
jgi:hypothetical protein